MKVFVLDLDHEENRVRVFGRTEDRRRVIIYVNYDFYVYVIPEERHYNEVKDILGNKPYIKRIDEERKRYLGKEYKVLKVYLNRKVYNDLKQDVDILKAEGKVIGKKEVDIPLHKKFSIDHGIFPLNWYEVSGRILEERKREIILFANPEDFRRINEKPMKLKVVAFDIEAVSENMMPDPEKDPIIMVSIYGDGIKKTIAWKNAPGDDIIIVKNERELIEKFISTIKEVDPDVIVGYNSNNFDFDYIYNRGKLLNIDITIGWLNEKIKPSKGRGSKRYRIAGAQHFDLYEFIVNLFAGQLRSDVYKLDEVAKEILGYGKTGLTYGEMSELWNKEEDIRRIVEYNLQDTKITYELFNHFREIAIELSRIVGISLEEVSHYTYGQLVEWYLIRKSREFNEIVPNKPKFEEVERRRFISYAGAFVLTPKPGFYKNIVVFDFRSLYPSIIITYNISYDTIWCEHEECKKDSFEIETSLGKKEVWFCKKIRGKIPSVLERIFNERAELKKRLKQVDQDSEEYKEIYAKQYALKILANSMYGYLGFPNSRWYCIECAAAITKIGREKIHFIVEEAKKRGLTPIYGDTDSVFLLYDSKEKALEFLQEINKKLEGPIELELEDFYKAGIFVKGRGSEKGAKKKYALISESEKIKLRGFETVRRDWAPIAKEVQQNVLQMILKGESRDKIIRYLKDIIQKIKKRELPIEYFVIREQIRRELSEYKSEGPHVYAAKRYKALGYDVRPGFIVEYIITVYGDKIRDKVRILPEVKDKEYDPEYYINNQVLPSIEQILNAVGISKENILGGQKSVLDFFR